MSAVGVGFEPTEGANPHSLSRRARSAASVPHRRRVYGHILGAYRPIYCSTETCGSGLTGAPGERVTPQGVQEFKSFRLRQAFVQSDRRARARGNRKGAAFCPGGRPIGPTEESCGSNSEGAAFVPEGDSIGPTEECSWDFGRGRVLPGGRLKTIWSPER